VEGVPHLVAFKSGTTRGAVFSRNPDNTIDVDQVADILGIYLSPKNLEHGSSDGGGGGGGSSESTTTKTVVSDSISTVNSRNVHYFQRQQKLDYADAFLSLYHTLSTSIYREEGIPLAAERRLVFIEWMDLLYWTLPSYWDVQQLIADIRSNMRSVVFSSAYLKEILERHAPPSTEWSHSCVPPSSTTIQVEEEEGYACGLWKLLHIISVGVVEQHQRVLGDKSRTAMSHIAAIYQDFVINFVGSKEFQTNFVNLYENCAFNRCLRLDPHPLTSESWKQFSLWLWELHNGQSKLLKYPTSGRNADSTEGQTAGIEFQWPSKNACPSCRNSDGKWIYDNVYAYLKQVYW
jgi:hypothetical protein